MLLLGDVNIDFLKYNKDATCFLLGPVGARVIKYVRFQFFFPVQQNAQ